MFVFVILNAKREESHNARIMRCFANAQHDKFPCVIASEQRERGKQHSRAHREGEEPNLKKGGQSNAQLSPYAILNLAQVVKQ